jgi:heme ABC exporter ATP-binding subunit CcmA
VPVAWSAVTAATPAIEMRGVVALLGTFPALSGCDLTIQRGEVVALRGPNGAGKTTVLKVVAGLVPIQRGSLQVLGSDVRTDRRSVRRYLGYLGHATGLYADLSVEQNVRFAVSAAGGAPESLDATVAAALAAMELDGRLRSLSVTHLSAGQRRRVALASLVARNVPLWLLDEPHAALDPQGRDLLDQLIIDAAATGTSVVMASHDLDRSHRIAQREINIVGGRAVTTQHVA